MKSLQVLFLMLFSSGLFAQTGNSYTLKDCIEYALQNNLTVRQSQVEVENQSLILDQSKAALLPTLNGFMGGNANTGRNIDPFTNGIVTQTIGTNNMGLSLSLPIYQGGRNRNTIDRNKLQVEASNQDLVTQRNNIALEVTVAYLNVLSSEDLIEVSKRQLEVTEQQYDRTAKLVKAGAAAETQLFDLEGQKANDELNLINAENSRQSAFLALTRAMNAPIELMFSLVKSEVPEPEMLARESSPAAIYSTAIGFLPEVKAGLLRKKASDVNIAMAKSLGLPTLSFNGSWGTAFSSVARRMGETTTTTQQIPVSAEFQGQTIPFIINMPSSSYTTEPIPYFSQLGNNQNYSFGLSLNVPIFNRFNVKYQTQTAQIQKKQVELQNDIVQLQIKQRIDQAYIDMLNAQKKYGATITQTNALEKAFVAAEKRYSAGAGNFVDYNLAKTNLDRAKTNLVLAKYDYIFRIKILDFYQNKPLEF